MTKEEVVTAVEERDVRFIRLWFTDILGQLKSFSITRDEVPSALEHGMGFDGSSITGFNAIAESDVVAMPDPSTFAILPYRPRERAVERMFCDIRLPGGEPCLPETLGGAIELGATGELLLKCLGEHIHSRFVELKREEWEDHRVRVTPYEVERYLPLL